MSQRIPVLDRMAAKTVEAPCLIKGLLPRCWIFTGYITAKGYGKIGIGDEVFRTHRVAYMELIGPIPEGLEPDHLCKRSECWNPWHLDPVTHAVNIRRARNHWRSKTHCPSGHAYDEANTYRPPGRPNHRCCRKCESTRVRVW